MSRLLLGKIEIFRPEILLYKIASKDPFHMARSRRYLKGKLKCITYIAIHIAV